jgi:hypothetical protein
VILAATTSRLALDGVVIVISGVGDFLALDSGGYLIVAYLPAGL